MKVHLGKKIEQVVAEKGIKNSYLAEKLNTVERNIYSIYERSDFKTDMLLKISEILEHDFFQYIRPTYANAGYSDRNGLENVTIVNEPAEPYNRRTTKLSISVDLDGNPATLKQQQELLLEINELINKKY